MNIIQLVNHLKLFTVRQQIRETFIKLGPKSLHGDVLDVGSGLQPYRELMTYSTYKTLDNNPNLKPDIVGDVMEMPIQDAQFDSVLCTDVLEHLPEPSKALDEIYRVLKPGGYVYVSSPFIWNLHYEPHDYFRFTKYGMSHLLKKAGFEMVDILPVGGIFTFVGARLSKFIYTLVDRILFFIPGKIRIPLAVLVSLPNSLLFYILAKLFDRFSKSPVSYQALARKLPHEAKYL